MPSSASSMIEVSTPSSPGRSDPPARLYNAGAVGKIRQLTGIAALCMAMLLTQSALGQSVLPLTYIASTFNVLDSPDASGQQSWFAASFSLTVGTFVLPAGRIGDIVGHKTIILIGYGFLSIWSMVAGLSHYTGSYVFFDICRAMQGVGCAVLLPNSLAILGRLFAPGTYVKHLAFSFYAATAPNGFVFGALFSTLMARNPDVGWWWDWYVMSITCALLAVLCVWALPSENEMKAVTASWNLDSKQQDAEPVIDADAASFMNSNDPLWKRLDLFGTVTGVTGLVLFNFVFNQALVVGWSTVYIYVLLIVSVFFLAVFIWSEGKALYPLLPTSVFHLQSALILLSLGCGWAAFGVWAFYTSLFNQHIRHYSPILAVVTFVPAGAAGIVAAFSSAKIMGKTSPPFVMLLSLLAFLIGSCLAGNSPVRVESLPYIASCIMPFGMDMSFPAASIILSDFLPAHQQGAASSIVNTVVNYSVALGLGFAGVVESHVNDGGRNILKGYRGAYYMGMGFAGLGVATALLNWGVQIRNSNKSGKGEKAKQEEGV
ncbi:related to aminotriazole resistance protein [Melanopsichium pennsylvanicum]|uniref:Related to aminotriazole resistance protein n=2 Tax=Melanopsichium pennsylvanicum TaxID=63383 RepID=A0AAJ4XI03_9BASI|nr:related to aminotriazole resistance protein [Melanopsichium pennsylvanicum 4]SNX82880.1 related to aminotriazole resistance protein [Melanopsichium pennsylvanicum]